MVGRFRLAHGARRHHLNSGKPREEVTAMDDCCEECTTEGCSTDCC
jgi:hypothetical protein